MAGALDDGPSDGALVAEPGLDLVPHGRHGLGQVGVLLADDQQCGLDAGPDLLEMRPQVERVVLQGVAAGDEAFFRGRAHQLAHAVRLLGVGLPPALAEPPRQRLLRQRGDGVVLGLGQLDSGGKDVRHAGMLRRAGDGVAEHQPLHDARVVGDEEDAGGRAHGDADPGVDLLDLQHLEQAKDVLAERLEGGDAGVSGRRGPAVAGLVVPQHAEARGDQLVDEGIPHVVVGEQRVGQQHKAAVLGAEQQVRNAAAAAAVAQDDAEGHGGSCRRSNWNVERR